MRPEDFRIARAALIAALDAQLAALTAARQRWWREQGLPPIDEDDGGAGVRVPADGGGSPPRLDQIAAPWPTPRTRLDVVGTTGGKVTIETRMP